MKIVGKGHGDECFNDGELPIEITAYDFKGEKIGEYEFPPNLEIDVLKKRI
jgi:hypothetical protein